MGKDLLQEFRLIFHGGFLLDLVEVIGRIFVSRDFVSGDFVFLVVFGIFSFPVERFAKIYLNRGVFEQAQVWRRSSDRKESVDLGEGVLGGRWRGIDLIFFEGNSK